MKTYAWRDSKSLVCVPSSVDELGRPFITVIKLARLSPYLPLSSPGSSEWNVSRLAESRFYHYSTMVVQTRDSYVYIPRDVLLMHCGEPERWRSHLNPSLVSFDPEYDISYLNRFSTRCRQKVFFHISSESIQSSDIIVIFHSICNIS